MGPAEEEEESGDTTCCRCVCCPTPTPATSAGDSSSRSCVELPVVLRNASRDVTVVGQPYIKSRFFFFYLMARSPSSVRHTTFLLPRFLPLSFPSVAKGLVGGEGGSGDEEGSGKEEEEDAESSSSSKESGSVSQLGKVQPAPDSPENKGRNFVLGLRPYDRTLSHSCEIEPSLPAPFFLFSSFFFVVKLNFFSLCV